MTDQAQRTTWALQQFTGFVNAYTPPALQLHCRDEIESVRRAICAIASPEPAHPVVGYAVFAQRPDRERECGFEHIAISATFDELAQAQHAYAYCVDHAAKWTETTGLKYFTICAVQQIPT